MRPGQITPNEFERALLERISEHDSSLRKVVADLHVLSREYTGAGSYTRFRCESPADSEVRPVGLDALVTVPGVPNGLGAVLFLRGGVPDFLEVYRYGEELWDGVDDGFEIHAG